MNNFTNDDIARMHGCVAHAIENFKRGPDSPSAKDLLEQHDMLVSMMLDNCVKTEPLNLALIYKCVDEEILRETINRDATKDRSMMPHMYRYSAHLEILRIRIESTLTEKNHD